jgi:hypothetical protein
MQKNLEIGFSYGYHADFICTVFFGITYVVVDPYQANYGPSYFFAMTCKGYLGLKTPGI